MDYPSDDEVINRFLEQGVFSEEEIRKAMDNTDICLTFDNYDDVYIFSKDIKLPTLYPGETKEQKDKRYSKLISKKFKEYMKNIPEDEYNKYFEGVKNEVQTYKDTGMCDYPLLDYAIINDAKKHGGLVTDTGRGCFTAEALINTDTTIKCISEVQIGDKVITSDGSFKTVINTMSYDIEEEMIKIDYLYGNNQKNPNICTLDHKILIHRNGNNLWIPASEILKTDYVCLPKIHNDGNNPEYIDLNTYNIFDYKYDDQYIYEFSPFLQNGYPYSARELSRKFNKSKKIFEDFAKGEKNDFARFPGLLEQVMEYLPFNSIKEYQQYYNDMHTIKIKRFIPLDNITGKFVGLMYGDGCNRGLCNEISLAINSDNFKNVDNREIFYNMADRLGLNVSEIKSENKKLIQLKIRSKIVSQLFKQELFVSKKGENKQFNPKYFNYSQDFRNGILWGLTFSDGSVSDNFRTAFDNSSPSLINAYKILRLSTKYGAGGLTIRNSGIDNRGYSRKISYKLRYPDKTDEKKRYLEDDNFWYLPIKQITKLDKIRRTVYDLTVEDSHNYLINNMIVHNSAVGYFTNTLCGFSNVDRFQSAIKLYPERFISTTRILETHSLPDIDINTGTPDILEESQVRILGEDHVAPMMAFGTLKKKSAFKLYAKAKGMEFELANTISNQLDEYEEAIKYADDEERDLISLYDYVDEQYKNYIEQSQEYWGVISDKKKAPSAYLLYQGNIRKEIGLIKCKSESTKKEYITCVIDGAIAENYKFLKNDILKVDVVLLIDKVFKRIGIEHFDVNTLLEKVKDNKAVWDIYANGYTIGVNQVEKVGSRHKCMNYKPTNVSELSAFVAAIRPGFRSMYDRFERREDFKWGIDALDNLLRTEELPVSFLFFQEQVMSVLNYGGFPMDECYGIIKAIAKKHPEKVRPLKDKFIDGFREKIIIDENLDHDTAQNYAEQVWVIINDNCGYGFNSAHAFCMALDSLYQAWQKATYPYEFYEVLLQHYAEKGNKDKVVELKNEMKKAFGIKDGQYRFRHDNRQFTADKEHHCIDPSLSSIKGIGKNLSQLLYNFRDKKFNSFIDLLNLFAQAEQTSLNSRQLDILIKLNYFEEFGEINTLLKQVEIYEYFKKGEAKQLSKDKIPDYIPKYILEKHCKETEKQYKILDVVTLLKEVLKVVEYPPTTLLDKLSYEQEYLGYIQTTVNVDKKYYYITDIKEAMLTLYQLSTGETLKIKCRKKTQNQNPIVVGNIIKVLKIEPEPKFKLIKDENGKEILDKNGKKQWYRDENDLEDILQKYSLVIC